MSKFQLFKLIPQKDFIENIIKLYGPNGFDINYYFTLDDIINNNVIDKLVNYVDELKNYYLPCKYHCIENITPRKTITILRQLLRPYNYKINSTEKYKNGKKYLLYNLTETSVKLNNNDLTIKFD